LITRAPAVRVFLGTLVWASAAFIAFGAFQFSLFAAKRLSNNAAAYALHPDDPQAMANHYDELIRTDPAYQLSKDDLIHARAALVHAQLNPTSLWVIGASSQASGDLAKADAAMDLANAISRRNLIVQLWLIERSVERDDLQAAVGHYNAVLAVEPKLGPILFPILSGALSFPEVRAALTPNLTGRSRWMPEFLVYAATHARLGSLAWTLSHKNNIEAALGQDGRLNVTLEPGASGLLATRDLPVKPGATYLFSQLASDTGAVPGQSLRWRAQCGSGPDTVIVGQFPVPWPEDASAFEARISVPENCILLRLSLTAEGQEAQLPAQLEISNLGLRPL